MTQRLDEQASYWAETGIFKHMEQQRLLEEKKAKEKAEEEFRRQHEPTPDLDSTSFTISATDTIKATSSFTSKTITTTLRTSSTVTITQNQSSASLRKNCNEVSLQLLNHSHLHSNPTNKKYVTANMSSTGKMSLISSAASANGDRKKLKRGATNKQSGNY